MLAQVIQCCRCKFHTFPGAAAYTQSAAAYTHFAAAYMVGAAYGQSDDKATKLDWRWDGIRHGFKPS